MREDFPTSIKEILAKRVGNRCSNPNCRCLTSGPQEDPSKFINVGVASHITAASPGGPRFDNSLTSDKRISPENGIWLCPTCGKLIDSDENRYTVEKIQEWKRQAERASLYEIEEGRKQQDYSKIMIFQKLERDMPDLLKEMRTDLTKSPLKREFVLSKRIWWYISDGNEFIYYFDDHPDLYNKIRILENYDLIRDITSKNAKRYLYSEDLVTYLTG